MIARLAPSIFFYCPFCLSPVSTLSPPNADQASAFSAKNIYRQNSMSSTITAASPVVQRLFASFAVPSVSSTPQLETPKKSTSRVKKSRPDKRTSPKPCFASGSFSESPSARAIPPPPVTWFIKETIETDQSGSDSDVSSSSSYSRDEMKTPEPGFRVNPLQLIAAVVSA